LCSFAGNDNFLASQGSLTITILASIYVLDPAASGALTLSGNAGINVPGCVVVDSSSTTALSASGNAQVTAGSIQVVGGYKAAGNATLSPLPSTKVSAVPDPLAGLAPPSTGVVRGSVNLSGNNSLTIDPGIYSQIKVSGNARLTLSSGVYILAGGGLTVTGNASISGNEVVFYNAGSNFPNGEGSFGGFTLSGKGTFSLSAPSSGPYAGMILFQARNNTRAISLDGNAVEGSGGTIYAPGALLYLSGNASLQGSLVVKDLTLSGNAVSRLTIEGTDNSMVYTAGQLLAGDLAVYVNDPNGLFTPVDALVESYGVVVVEVLDPCLANVVVDTGSTSAAGGYAEGVLGCETGSGEITLIQGWDWYAGGDTTQIGTDQYDFQTVVTHELGHALGLGHNADSTSVMKATLEAGTARRMLTTPDLAIPDPGNGPSGLHAGVRPRAAATLPVGNSLPSLMGVEPSEQPLFEASWGAGLVSCLQDTGGSSLSGRVERAISALDAVYTTLAEKSMPTAFPAAWSSLGAADIRRTLGQESSPRLATSILGNGRRGLAANEAGLDQAFTDWTEEAMTPWALT
jgi:hypothetical protein